MGSTVDHVNQTPGDATAYAFKIYENFVTTVVTVGRFPEEPEMRISTTLNNFIHQTFGRNGKQYKTANN